MTKSKKVHVVLALILYPPFILTIIAMILLQLFEKGIIENAPLYNLLTKINQMIDPYQWPQWCQSLFGIFIITVIIIIVTAELGLHKRMLKRAQKAAEKEMQENLSGHGTPYWSDERRIINSSRIWQVLLYAILIVLTPAIFPIDAIIHLVIYRNVESEDELDEDDI